MKLKLLASAALISVPFMVPHIGLAEGDAVWTVGKRSTGMVDNQLRTCEGDALAGVRVLRWKDVGDSGIFKSPSAQNIG